MWRSAENVKWGTLLDLLTYILLQNIEKLEERTLWFFGPSFKKIAKKVEGGPFSLVRFCRLP